MNFLAYTQEAVCVGTPTLYRLEHGGSIMLWGCLSPTGTWKLLRIDGKVEGAEFRETLKENLLEALEDCGRRSLPSRTMTPDMQ